MCKPFSEGMSLSDVVLELWVQIRVSNDQLIVLSHLQLLKCLYTQTLMTLKEMRIEMCARLWWLVYSTVLLLSHLCCHYVWSWTSRNRGVCSLLASGRLLAPLHVALTTSGLCCCWLPNFWVHQHWLTRIWEILAHSWSNYASFRVKFVKVVRFVLLRPQTENKDIQYSICTTEKLWHS